MFHDKFGIFKEILVSYDNCSQLLNNSLRLLEFIIGAGYSRT